MERNENLSTTHIETRKSQRWVRGVYEIQVSKINYKSIRLPLFLVMDSTCTLGPWQCLPGPIFRPRNFNVKMGPGDEANLEVGMNPMRMVLRYKEGGGCLVCALVRKGGGWVFDGTR